MKKLIYLMALPLALCLIWGFTVEVVYATPILEPSQHFKSIDVPTPTRISIPNKIANRTPKIKPVATNQKVQNIKIINTVELKSDEKPIYSRYPGINARGEACDMVEIRTAGGGGASVEVRKNGKAVIIINGIRYSEEEMKVMSKDRIANIKSISAIDDNAVKKYYPELADKYDGVIELPSRLSFN